MAIAEINEADYGSDPVYFDHEEVRGDWSEHAYFENVAMLRERCAEANVPLPDRIHACYSEGIKLDARDILDDALQEHHEDAYDQLVDVDSLAAFLKYWCAKQTMKTWYKDSKLLVVLTPAAAPANEA